MGARAQGYPGTRRVNLTTRLGGPTSRPAYRSYDRDRQQLQGVHRRTTWRTCNATSVRVESTTSPRVAIPERRVQMTIGVGTIVLILLILLILFFVRRA